MLTQHSCSVSSSNKSNSEYENHTKIKNNESEISSYKFNKQNNNKSQQQNNCYNNIINNNWQSSLSSISTQTSGINIYRRASILEEYALQQLNKINLSNNIFNTSIMTTNSSKTTCINLCKMRAKIIIKRSRTCLIVALDKTRPRCKWWRKIRYAKFWRQFSTINKRQEILNSKITQSKLSFVNIKKVGKLIILKKV